MVGIVRALVLVGGLFGWASGVGAATYFVEFDNGKDGASGTSEQTAWKHCPGDALATETPAKVQLRPGDIVRFKGGVVYRGSIAAKWSGEEGKPITYDGNSDGKWGTGRAVIDGSEPVTEWTACKGPEEARGNPKWKSICWALLPKGVLPGTANLCEGEKLLWIAQSPPQPDPFYMDKIEHFYTVPNKDVTTTSIVDSEHLNQKDEHYWDDAQIMVWVTPNVTDKRAVTQFIPSENKIVFAKTGEPYRDRPEHYAMYNCVQIMARPGEYVVGASPEPDGRVKAFLLPLDGNDLSAGKVTVSVRGVGFDVVGGAAYVTIQGFRIQKMSGPARVEGVGIRAQGGNKETQHLVVRNNVFAWLRSASRGYGGVFIDKGRHCRVEDNRIFECPLSMGILVGGGSNILVQNNTLSRIGAQCIWYMGVSDSQIIGNTITDSQGTHSNGISVYQGSSNILVRNNTVSNSNIAITVERSTNVTVCYNVCRFDSGYAMADWGGCTNLKIHNNTLVRQTDLPALSVSSTSYEAKNNLVTWWAPTGEDGKATRNYHFQQSRSPSLFVDPAKGDYHVKAGSPVINRGLDLNYTQDHDGKLVPQGEAPEIGAYEYSK